mmetsp:Transcript_27886/g.41137  ORF Transcript_27886/g.41137 Transcript_27886/m.41137 type:complete len:99 (+) Transcript_27886:109-405(+)
MGQFLKRQRMLGITNQFSTLPIYVDNIYNRGRIEVDRCKAEKQNISCDKYVKMRNHVIEQPRQHINNSVDYDQNYIDLYAMLYKTGMDFALRASQLPG